MKNFNKILFAFVLAFVFAFGALTAYGKVEYIKTRLSYDGAMHNYEAEAVYISINGKTLNSYSIIPLVMNDRILVCARDVFAELGCEISWDGAKREVTVSKNGDVIVIPINKKTIYKNGNAIAIDVAPKLINNYTMIPVRAVAESLDCEVGFDSATRVVSITSKVVTTTETTTEATTAKPAVASAPAAKPHSKNEKGITILFDTISSYEGNDSDSKRIAAKGLDVLCPTWFAVTDKSGTVSNIAKKSYADWAHSQGYEVWGLVTNSFDADIATGFLNDSAASDKVIDELLKGCLDVGADGINVDFEPIGSGDGDAYVAFMEKLADKFHENNLTVSVDTFIPTAYNERYHMEDMGEICDYVIMMAYDEHYAGSSEAGSVASLPWAEEWLAEASKLVESDKLIFGCPFYTRAWHISSEGKIIANAAYGMENAEKLLSDNEADIVYDSGSGQNVGEYVNNGSTVKIWLEDETSLRARLDLSQEYGVGGVAFWRRGFEKAEAWDIINEYY